MSKTVTDKRASCFAEKEIIASRWNGSKLAELQLEETPSPLCSKFHVFPSATTTEITRESENCLGTLAQSESLCRVMLFGVMNAIPTQVQAPKDEYLLLRLAKDNATFVAKFKPGYFIYVGPGDEEIWEFHRRAHPPHGQ